MKQEDIKPCIGCGKGVAHNKCMAFYQIKLGSRILNLPAVQRQTGLEMAMGSPVLAMVMGPGEDIAINLGEDVTGLVCMDCAVSKTVAELWELMGKEEEKLVDSS